MYYFYILRCSDNSLYCGQTSDLERRIHEHNFDKNRSAKYLRGKTPAKLVYFEERPTLSVALKREAEIKKWTKSKKETLVINFFYRNKQIEVINGIEKQVKNKALTFSTVTPVKDYENDSRICLTSVHFPHQSLVKKIHDSFIDPLKKIAPNYFYYPKDSLHMTIKNIRVINDPPHFTEKDILKAERIFSGIIPKHKKFQVYFYRLLLFPNNLTLIGTTDPELDKIFLDLDKRLDDEGISDDKRYNNSKYFFSNITLARFSNPSDVFKNKVKQLNKVLTFEPYTVDSVTLITCNAVFKKRRIINSWSLR